MVTWATDGREAVKNIFETASARNGIGAETTKKGIAKCANSQIEQVPSESNGGGESGSEHPQHAPAPLPLPLPQARPCNVGMTTRANV